jgi:hypothetical protein
VNLKLEVVKCALIQINEAATLVVGWLFLKSNQTSSDCRIDCFGAARYTELSENVCHVHLDRGLADVEQRSYLFVAFPDGKRPQNIALPFGQILGNNPNCQFGANLRRDP